MKFILGLLVLLLLPIPVVVLYFFTESLIFVELDTYSIASILGIAGFVWALAQFPVAAKVFGLGKFFTPAQRMRLHGVLALLTVAALQGHFFFKASVEGFEPTGQTVFGFLALFLFTSMTLVAIFFLGHHFPAPAKTLASLRTWVKNHWKWTYAGLRGVHGILVLLGGALAGTHVLLAQSTQASPWTTGVMAAWLGLCLLSYGIYRLRGRKG